MGTEAFVQEYVKRKVQQWLEEVKHLSAIAHTQPHGLSTYISRTIPD